MIGARSLYDMIREIGPLGSSYPTKTSHHILSHPQHHPIQPAIGYERQILPIPITKRTFRENTPGIFKFFLPNSITQYPLSEKFL